MELLGSIEMTSDATTLDLHVNASTILILEMTIPFGMRLGIDTLFTMEQAPLIKRDLIGPKSATAALKLALRISHSIKWPMSWKTILV